MARPGHDHLVMGCFKWAAARVLVHLVGTSISVWQGDMVQLPVAWWLHRINNAMGRGQSACALFGCLLAVAVLMAVEGA